MFVDPWSNIWCWAAWFEKGQLLVVLKKRAITVSPIPSLFICNLSMLLCVIIFKIPIYLLHSRYFREEGELVLFFYFQRMLTCLAYLSRSYCHNWLIVTKAFHLTTCFQWVPHYMQHSVKYNSDRLKLCLSKHTI